MRILIVGLSDTLQLARWCGALTGLGWDIHVFPVFCGNPDTEPDAHPLLTGVTYWDTSGVSRSRPQRDVLVRSPLSAPERGLRRIAGRSPDRALVLARLIRRLGPDIVHSMELQHAAYLTLSAYRLLREGEKPRWIVSNHGIDISLFAQLPEHGPSIRSVLSAADVYHCECQRDVALARQIGSTGAVGPVTPMAGGWDLDAAAVYRTPGPTSRRRTIALKGRESGLGRAGVALEALRRCGDLLTGYTLELYMTSSDFVASASRLTRETGITVKPLAGTVGLVSQQEVLALHGRARVSIALSIAAGASTSMLEAMIMGSFPIQSDTACADEWIEDGVSGLIVPPEDPESVAQAIRRALTDSVLVDHATRINDLVALERLEFNVVRNNMIALYEEARVSRATATLSQRVRGRLEPAQSSEVRRPEVRRSV